MTLVALFVLAAIAWAFWFRALLRQARDDS
jgi:hypothetical protein